MNKSSTLWEGCVKPLCDLFLWPDPEIVTVFLKALENILMVGKTEKNMGTTNGEVNQYAQFVEEADGFGKIENLQIHDSNEISEKAVEILKTYSMQGMRFKDEEEDAQGSEVITDGKVYNIYLLLF